MCGPGRPCPPRVSSLRRAGPCRSWPACLSDSRPRSLAAADRARLGRLEGQTSHRATYRRGPPAGWPHGGKRGLGVLAQRLVVGQRRDQVEQLREDVRQVGPLGRRVDLTVARLEQASSWRGSTWSSTPPFGLTPAALASSVFVQPAVGGLGPTACSIRRRRGRDPKSQSRVHRFFGPGVGLCFGPCFCSTIFGSPLHDQSR